jgi:ring-1,2-phenylacetyl-CoA epoxidase subunit PaaC
LGESEEAKMRIQSTINEVFPYALGMFEPSEFEAELQEAGIFDGEFVLREKWLNKVVPLLESYGYAVPNAETIIPEFGGRKGQHTEYLQPLLDEMTEVFAIDPGADW